MRTNCGCRRIGSVLAWRNSRETFARIADENQLPGNDPAAVADYLAADKRFVTVEGLGLITANALVIDGSADGAGQSELVATTIPKAEHVTLDGADHFEIPTLAKCLDVAVPFITNA